MAYPSTQVTDSKTSTVRTHSTYLFPSFNTKFKRLQANNFNVKFLSILVCSKLKLPKEILHEDFTLQQKCILKKKSKNALQIHVQYSYPLNQE